ncbi:MAG: D-alanyl-D-alanine carboxypeptidase/D-alanyl-D-alanine-endopeptidase [Planctomycetota bacterium]
MQQRVAGGRANLIDTFIYRAALAMVALALAAAASAGDADLEAALQKVLAPGDRLGTTTAVRVVDAESGEVLASSRLASVPFIPASNMKLVTTAVILDRLGPDAELRTRLLRVNDDELVILAGGDPGLGDPPLSGDEGAMGVLRRWAAAVKEAGITEVSRITVVDPMFDAATVHRQWGQANILYWYGAPVAGVAFNDNCIDFIATPTELGQLAVLQTIPPVRGFVVRHEASTSPADDHGWDMRKARGELTYTSRGAIGRKAGPWSLPHDDPARLLGHALASALEQVDIAAPAQVGSLTGEAADKAAAEALKTGEVIAEHATPLVDVLGRVNTNSQNMMAEAICKLAAVSDERLADVFEGPRGTWRGGNRAAVAFLDAIDIDTAGFVASDGSGLSDRNRISAEQLTDLLRHMLVEHEHAEAYKDSMAISGTRGSVRRRMNELKGQVYAKTGTINGVSALSGCLDLEDGRRLIFSVLHNGHEGSAGPLRRIQDNAVLAIHAWATGGDEPTVTQE